MSRDTVYRFGGGAAMLGAVITIVFTLLHPSSATAFYDLGAGLHLVATSDIWVFDHFMLGWGLTLSFVGLLTIAASMTDNATWLARLARSSAGIGLAVGLVMVAVDGTALKLFAVDHEGVRGPISDLPGGPSGPIAAFALMSVSAGNAVAQVSAALFTVTIWVFFGLAPVFFGLSILNSDVFPRWTGWTALVAGAGGLLTASIQFLSGVSAVTADVLFPIVSAIFNLVIFLLGWMLWRRTASRSDAPRSKGA